MKTSSKTVGLMIEIILSTVFFAVVCTVVLQLLLQAQKLEQYSRDKSGAIALAQSIGDIFRSHMSDSPQALDLMLSLCYGEALFKEEEYRYTIYLNERMLPDEQAQLKGTAPSVEYNQVPQLEMSSFVTSQREEENLCFASVILEDVKNVPAGTMSRVSIQVEKRGRVLFELSVDRYRPGGSIGSPNLKNSV